MPGPPTKSTLDNQALRRQQVGNPKLFGTHPNRRLFQQNMLSACATRCSTCTSAGALFQQDSVSRDFWMEDPRPLTKLLTEDQLTVTSLVYPRCSQPCCATPMTIRSSLQRNRVQGDVVLIDFLQSEVMQKNCPTLSPSTLWALAHCMKKKRFAFGTVIGVGCLRGDPQFTIGLQEYAQGKGG